MSTAFSNQDVLDLAATIQGEAEGESFEGKIAVGHTVKNRMDIAGASVQDVVYGSGHSKYGQFSVFNDRSGYARVQASARKNTPSWQESVKAAEAILSGSVPDPTKGATHYYNPKEARPAWRNSGVKTVTIGGHTFQRIDAKETRSVVRAAASSRHRRSPVDLRGVSYTQAPVELASVPQSAPHRADPMEILGVSKPDIGPATAYAPAPSLSSPFTNVQGEPPVKEISIKNGVELEGLEPEMYSFISELKSHVSPELAEKLVITSAYRSPARNARTKGSAKNSQHTVGFATDFRINNLNQAERQELMTAALKAGAGGVGIKSDHFHFDIRGTKATWGASPAWAQELMAQYWEPKDFSKTVSVNPKAKPDGPRAQVASLTPDAYASTAPVSAALDVSGAFARQPSAVNPELPSNKPGASAPVSVFSPAAPVERISAPINPEQPSNKPGAKDPSYPTVSAQARTFDDSSFRLSAPQDYSIDAQAAKANIDLPGVTPSASANSSAGVSSSASASANVPSFGPSLLPELSPYGSSPADDIIADKAIASAKQRVSAPTKRREVVGYKTVRTQIPGVSFVEKPKNLEFAKNVDPVMNSLHLSIPQATLPGVPAAKAKPRYKTRRVPIYKTVTVSPHSRLTAPGRGTVSSSARPTVGATDSFGHKVNYHASNSSDMYVGTDEYGRTSYGNSQNRSYTLPGSEVHVSYRNKQNQQGSSGSGDSKIICRELFLQGRMPYSIYAADERFGDLMVKNHIDIVRGYHFWAKSVVRRMDGNVRFSKLVYWLTRPWTEQMAHKMGVKGAKWSLIGAAAMVSGLAICWVIGKSIKIWRKIR